MFSLKKKTAKPELRVVVDNKNFFPAVFEGRLGKMRRFLKKVRVISNGPYLPKMEREALEMAEWIENRYFEYLGRHFGETEALIPFVQKPNEEVRKKAIELLRAKKFSVTCTEFTNRPGGRFT